MTAGGAEQQSGPASSLRELAEIIGLATVPLGALAGLGFYFGWRRTQTYVSYFGLDSSMLDLSIQDYLLRSSTSLFNVVLVLVLAGLVALAVHRTVLRHSSTALLTALVLGLLGLLCLAVWFSSPLNSAIVGLSGRTEMVLGALGLVAGAAAVVRVAIRRWGRPTNLAWLLVVPGTALMIDAAALDVEDRVLDSPWLARPTVLAAGLVLLAYATSIRHMASPARHTPRWLSTLSTVLLGLLVACGVFAATDEYADAVGTHEAELTAALLEGRRGVVVFTKKDQALPPSVICTPLGPDSAYGRRCIGLRLLTRTSDSVLAVPAIWSRDDGIDDNDRVVVLREGADLRLEFTPGESDFPYRPR